MRSEGRKTVLEILFGLPVMFFLSIVFIMLFYSMSGAEEKELTGKKLNIQKSLEKTKEELGKTVQCPAGMVPVTGGESDKIWLMRDDGKQERISSEPYKIKPFCMDKFEYPNKKHAKPVVHVSFLDAREKCKKAGKRLCTEREWEWACTNSLDWKYCYGNQFEAWRCNTTGVIVGDIKQIGPTGSHPGCKNFFGVYDLNGNVSEWVDTVEPGNMGVLRGGTAWVSNEYGQSCFSRHLHPITDNQWPDDGFRCCTDADNALEKTAN